MNDKMCYRGGVDRSVGQEEEVENLLKIRLATGWLEVAFVIIWPHLKGGSWDSKSCY